MDIDRFCTESANYDKPSGKSFLYGTAGFRTDGSLLLSTVFRCGGLAAARSFASGGKATGLVITASHNPEADNGVKLVDPHGGMLEMELEALAERLANASTPDELRAAAGALLHGRAAPAATVLIARDTRPTGIPQVAPWYRVWYITGLELATAAIAGAEAFGARVHDLGVLTTPQLHFAVLHANSAGAAPADCVTAHRERLAAGFAALVENSKGAATASCPVLIDCANGVGAAHIAALSQHPAVAGSGLRLELRNCGPADGGLNHLVGADFVQKERVPPKNFAWPADKARRCVSVDGDADRLARGGQASQVYFDLREDGSLRLFDGDKIAALLAGFARELLLASGLGGLRLLAVQTAYANGASTGCIRSTGAEVALAKTGVKFLHELAERADVGCYFEANGHGTLLFSPGAREAIRAASEEPGQTPERAGALRRLRALTEAMNPAVGDALSGVLAVEAVLRYRGWGLDEWDALYRDLPSRQLKVKVPDRAAIVTTDAETRCAAPAGLQARVDAAVAKAEKGRAFVRPSGTEDIVRVYAEASTQVAADALAAEVADAVRDVLLGMLSGAAPPAS